MHSNPDMSIGLFDSNVLHGLTRDQYEAVVQDGCRIKLQPKSILFRQGDPASRCFMLITGCLKLTILSEQGNEVILRYIGTGELTGAVTVLKERRYPVTAESIEETEVIGWDKDLMIQLMHKIPDIAVNLLSMVLERLDDMQERYLEICSKNVDQRIARTLMRLMRVAGLKTDGGILINIPLSRQNIAEFCGTTLYTVSRTLSTWEKKGWIKSRREQIIVIDAHALVQFSEAF